MSGTAQLADIFETFVGPNADVRFEAFDGSSAGPSDAPVTLRLVDESAVQYIATAPSDLGIARAFVSGSIEVIGDLYTGLRALIGDERRPIPWSQAAELFRSYGPRLVRRPPVPPLEAPHPLLRGRRHSKSRDAAAIAHHYDVSNRFYAMVLGPSMTYTCAVYPTLAASLEEAQAAKYDLVARKLGLDTGMRLLDVGCGWGGMVMHAAEHYGVRALGVTLSRQQAEWANKAIAERGLSDRAEVRFLDYRDVPEAGFDAISSIGLTEHIGRRNYPSYFGRLSSKLRPGGRLLNHCITRPNGRERAKASGFIDRYIFPDGELSGPAIIMAAMNDNGFEIRHEENLREHYAMTLRDWGRNLDAQWEPAVADVGLAKARVWRLYMAGSRVGFDLNRIQLHQVLGVRVEPRGISGMPLRPTWAS
jgi:cyclopropane-fatty-acyl-phospholipid synthase